ncbi:MAG TPA: hypothetical protein VF814_05820 [Casimicrobiaceae bacterium]
MTSAKSTIAIPEGTAAVSPPQWWRTAATLLGIALGVVLLYAVATKSSGGWADGPAPIVVSGSGWIPVEGTGRRDGDAFVLTAPGAGGVAVLAAKLTPFQAKDFPRLEWALDSADPPSEVFLVWRTREHPKRNSSKRLEWLVNGVAPLELSADDGWSGTVTGVALVVRSSLAAPLRVGALRMASPSATEIASALWRQWSARILLRGYSISFPFDSERAHYLPLLSGVAVAEGIAILAYGLLARRRGWPRDRRVLWAIFLGGWILLDLRWQVNLWQGAIDQGVRFAGKTTEAKHRAAGDAALYALLERIKAALPAPPARVVLFCDNVAICSRAAFFLYPHNVFRAVDASLRPPDPQRLRAGDYLLIAYSRTLGYDPGRGVVVWPDGRTRPAEQVLLQPEALLLRVR